MGGGAWLALSGRTVSKSCTDTVSLALWPVIPLPSALLPPSPLPSMLVSLLSVPLPAKRPCSPDPVQYMGWIWHPWLKTLQYCYISMQTRISSDTAFLENLTIWNKWRSLVINIRGHTEQRSSLDIYYWKDRISKWRKYCLLIIEFMIIVKYNELIIKLTFFKCVKWRAWAVQRATRAITQWPDGLKRAEPVANSLHFLQVTIPVTKGPD